MIIALTSCAAGGTRILHKASDSLQWLTISRIKYAKFKICPVDLDREVMPVVGGKRRLKQKVKRMVANLQKSSIRDGYDPSRDGKR